MKHANCIARYRCAIKPPPYSREWDINTLRIIVNYCKVRNTVSDDGQTKRRSQAIFSLRRRSHPPTQPTLTNQTRKELKKQKLLLQ